MLVAVLAPGANLGPTQRTDFQESLLLSIDLISATLSDFNRLCSRFVRFNHDHVFLLGHAPIATITGPQPSIVSTATGANLDQDNSFLNQWRAFPAFLEYFQHNIPRVLITHEALPSLLARMLEYLAGVHLT